MWRYECGLCQSPADHVVEFQPTPLANELVTEEFVRLGKQQDEFPLPLAVCRGCGHVQLGYLVDPERLFRHYTYRSGVSPVFVAHLRGYAEEMTRLAPLGPDDLVVEIGSNDGTLLAEFQRLGIRTLGVDPARNIAELARQAGVDTIAEFFGVELADRIVREHGRAKLVCANNVFAHSPQLDDIALGVRRLLTDDGVFVFEVGYFVDVVRKTLFDTVYHEHTDYHHLSPLVEFFDRLGMSLYDAYEVDTQGGSVRAFVSVAERPRTDRLARLIAAERDLGLKTYLDREVSGHEPLMRLARSVARLRGDLLATLGRLKADGKRIVGYGAPAKCVTLMHEFGFGAETLDFIVDDSLLKHHLVVPGKHIPILPVEAMYEAMPDYVLILGWNFADSVMRRHGKYVESGGRFIVPLPEVVIHD